MVRQIFMLSICVISTCHAQTITQQFETRRISDNQTITYSKSGDEERYTIEQKIQNPEGTLHTSLEIIKGPQSTAELTSTEEHSCPNNPHEVNSSKTTLTKLNFDEEYKKAEEMYNAAQPNCAH